MNECYVYTIMEMGARDFGNGEISKSKTQIEPVCPCLSLLEKVNITCRVSRSCELKDPRYLLPTRTTPLPASIIIEYKSKPHRQPVDQKG